MRKIFTFLFAALMSVGMFATTVTWDSNTLSSIHIYDGESFTQDGVTVTSLIGMINGETGQWMGNSNDASFKFSTSLGNFTKIEITATIHALGGSGWTQTSPGAVWTGEANETTFGEYVSSVSQIVFTIGEPAPAPATCGPNLTWDLTDGVLTISGTGDMYDYLYFEDPAPWDSSKESITSVIISNGVTRIGYYAFAGCTSLTTVTIPNSVTIIGYSAFYNCSSLTSVTIPNSVTSIETGVFSGCSSLTSVTIGNSVTSIGNGAFLNCSSLTSVTIPNSVTSIGERAFARCSNLETVTILAESLESYGTYAFDGTAATLKIYVPAGSVDTYKAAENWTAYADKIEAIPAPADPNREYLSLDPSAWSWGYNSVSGTVADGLQTTIISDWGAVSMGWDPERDLTEWDKIVFEVSHMEDCANDYWKLKAYLRDESDSEGKQMEGFLGLDAPDNQLNYLVIDLHQQVEGFDLTKARVLAVQCEPTGGIFTISSAYLLKEDHEGVEEVPSDQVQSTKVLRDGVIYIVRDGKLFNLTGAQVK